MTAVERDLEDGQVGEVVHNAFILPSVWEKLNSEIGDVNDLDASLRAKENADPRKSSVSALSVKSVLALSQAQKPAYHTLSSLGLTPFLQLWQTDGKYHLHARPGFEFEATPLPVASSVADGEQGPVRVIVRKVPIPAGR